MPGGALCGISGVDRFAFWAGGPPEQLRDCAAAVGGLLRVRRKGMDRQMVHVGVSGEVGGVANGCRTSLVEVEPVLNPSEKAVFEGMVTQMRADDPSFTQRVERLCRPRRRIRTALAVLLWMVAPVCVVLGGWTGVIMAVVAVGYGAHLYAKRDVGSRESLSPRRRPGVSN